MARKNRLKQKPEKVFNQRWKAYQILRRQKQQSPLAAELPPEPSATPPISKSPVSSPVTPALLPTPPKRSYHPLFSLLRLGILGVGLAGLVGTVLAFVHPADRNQKALPPEPNEQNTVALNVMEQAIQQGTRLTSLEQQMRNEIAARPGLTAGAFFLNLDTGAYADVNGAATFPAASTIKTPILVAFFQDVDAGKIKLDERLVMRPDLIASEAGIMQYQKPGTKFSALETADLMITISDNTATNMLIDRLGGAAALNQRFLSWGLQQTVIRNWLPDLKGTNTTSAKDLAYLMMLVGRGDLVSVRSRDRLLDIMHRTVTNTLLPQGLGEGAKIAHKTGDIGIVIGDGGMVDMPSGQRYVAAAMVRRPYNDVRGRELIQQMSRLTYQAFSKPLPKQASSSATSTTNSSPAPAAANSSPPPTPSSTP
uniref:Putative beta-lactamase n=1 Tax=Cyanothece sp. (strain PCC 7425 / ATCC 29141) TaxID=395961 RepID=B8HLP2_CYAP4